MKISKNILKKGKPTPGTKEFNDRYLDKQEVLQTFKISSRTLQTWRDCYDVVFIRIGNKTYYLRESLDNLIASNSISNEIAVDPGPIIQEEALPGEVKESPSETITTQPTDTRQPKLLIKIWDPIPGYLYPILAILIYFLPYADDIMRGEKIDIFYLFLPLMAGIVIGVPFILFHTGIKSLKKYITSKNSLKKGENNKHSS